MKNDTRKPIRQGDVMLEPIAALPETAQPKNTEGRAIIAYGEVTGHHHSFAPKSVKLFQYQEGGNAVAVLEVPKRGAQIEHQEHSAIPLEAGAWRHVQQVEYTPEAIRNVAD